MRNLKDLFVVAILISFSLNALALSPWRTMSTLKDRASIIAEVKIVTAVKLVSVSGGGRVCGYLYSATVLKNYKGAKTKRRVRFFSFTKGETLGRAPTYLVMLFGSSDSRINMFSEDQADCNGLIRGYWTGLREQTMFAVYSGQGAGAKTAKWLVTSRLPPGCPVSPVQLLSINGRPYYGVRLRPVLANWCDESQH